MATTLGNQQQIEALKREYDALKKGKDALLVLLDEAEVPEAVYNSNAIEASTLTLKETEKILLDLQISREVSVREVFEAKNLARVSGYIRLKCRESEVSVETTLLLHQMLITGINDRIAGRFRGPGEYVRVGTHVAPAPEHVARMVEAAVAEYGSDLRSFPIDKVARFHLMFEHIHPFNDGNGRIGRVLINWQLGHLGFPGVIIRDKEKQEYYHALSSYDQGEDTRPMERILTLALTESLHKRIAYLRGVPVVSLAEYVKKHRYSAPALANAARRQSIPAFREKGVWKIASDYRHAPRPRGRKKG